MGHLVTSQQLGRAGRERLAEQSRRHRSACRKRKRERAAPGANLFRSGKGAASPSLPPLRTGRASFPASGSSIGKRTLRHAVCPHTEHASTLPRRSRQRNRRKPHQQEWCTPPTCLLCFHKSVCQTLHVGQHPNEVRRLSPS